MSGLPPVRVCLVGAGLIGERHARTVAGHPDCILTAIIDPDEHKHGLARELDARAYRTLDEMPEDSCEAVIVATPNGLHLPQGLACLERGLPCLIEKPIADSIASGQTLSDAFASAEVPLLIGHHRRYHPFVERARSLIASGEIGTPVFASIIWAVRKPHSYFDEGKWRLGSDGGPLLINLIHEIDLMRCIFGPLDTVQAIVSNLQRGVARWRTPLLCWCNSTAACWQPWLCRMRPLLPGVLKGQVQKIPTLPRRVYLPGALAAPMAPSSSPGCVSGVMRRTGRGIGQNLWQMQQSIWNR